jgi:ubiquitin-conjugating enzyme E2 G2
MSIASSALIVCWPSVELITKPTEGITAGPIVEDNFFEWEAYIMCVMSSASRRYHSIADSLHHLRGPPDTPYEGGMFTAVINFPNDYPLNPPKIRFTCEMWHPNSMCCLALIGHTDSLSLTD